MGKVLSVIAMFLIAAGAIISVTCYQQKFTEKEKLQVEDHAAETSQSHSENNEQSSKKAQDNSDKLPCWHILFAWPNGITAWAIIATLFVIGWQSIEAANAAKAAQLSAQFAIDSERAWMIAKMDKPIIPLERERWFFATIPKLTNKGKTPAFIVEIGNAIAVLARNERLPAIPSGYEERNIFRSEGRGISIPPEGEAGKGIVHEIEDPTPFHKGDSILWVHGYVKYRDVFVEEIRETRYCFRCVPSLIIGMNDHSFVIDGPPAYNRAT